MLAKPLIPASIIRSTWDFPSSSMRAIKESST